VSTIKKGLTQLYGITIGLITLFVGVALMYMLPDYIITALNSTAVFTNTTVALAQTQANSIRSLGFVVIIISVIWLIFSVIGGQGGG
jgi:membrane-anchored glycerophosphoryl diester phosphodiesterase (GDPDase)